jgi:hypothetical protein
LIDLKHINVARARTPVRVDPRTIDVERAVVARALEDAFGRNEFERPPDGQIALKHATLPNSVFRT